MITRSITRPITSPIARAVTAAYGAWNPRALFANGEQGVIYDPNDLTTLFQDSAGTTPVTAAGQPVGLMLDKSRGLVRGAELIANPSFDNGASDWTVDPAWTVAGGEATKAGTGSENLYQNNAGIVAGKWYAVTLVCTGSIRLLVNQRAVPTVAETAIAGVKTFYVLAPAVDTYPGITICSAQSGTVVRSVSVRELPGNHAFQSTAASRPILRQTPKLGPELVVNGDFSNGTVGWTAINAQTFSNVGGELTATTNTAVYAARQNVATTIGKTYIVTASGRRVSASPFVQAHSGTAELGFSQTGSTSNAPISFTFVASTTSTQINLGTPGGLGQAFWDNISVREIVGYYTDRNYLETDGADDWMSTSPIDFTGTDKVSVFTGVRKLSDAAVGMLVELSTTSLTNQGTFSIRAPQAVGASGDYAFLSGGSIPGVAVASSGVYLAPSSAVLRGVGSISGDISRCSVNGVSGVLVTADQGSGNYGNYPLYLFRRGGTTLPFTGHFYGLTIVGRLTTDAETSSMERLLAQRTGVQLA